MKEAEDDVRLNSTVRLSQPIKIRQSNDFNGEENSHENTTTEVEQPAVVSPPTADRLDMQQPVSPDLIKHEEEPMPTNPNDQLLSVQV